MNAKRLAISIAVAAMMGAFGPAFAQSSSSDTMDSGAPSPSMPTDASQPATSDSSSSPAAGGTSPSTEEAMPSGSSESTKQEEDKASD